MDSLPNYHLGPKDRSPDRSVGPKDYRNPSLSRACLSLVLGNLALGETLPPTAAGKRLPAGSSLRRSVVQSSQQYLGKWSGPLGRKISGRSSTGSRQHPRRSVLPLNTEIR